MNESDVPRCKGGIKAEVMKMTSTTNWYAAYKSLQDLCDAALDDATEKAQKHMDTWDYLENVIGLEDVFARNGFLNTETGNFQQDESIFVELGGYERFLYVGEDPRLNDHFPTTKRSYFGGEAVSKFYANEAKKSSLPAPTHGF